mgnify:CR=1 FL=1
MKVVPRIETNNSSIDIIGDGNKVIEIYGNPRNQDKINVGNVRFTRNGQVLYRIVDDAYKGYNNHILEFMIERLKHRNCKIIINEKIYFNKVCFQFYGAIQ